MPCPEFSQKVVEQSSYEGLLRSKHILGQFWASSSSLDTFELHEAAKLTNISLMSASLLKKFGLPTHVLRHFLKTKISSFRNTAIHNLRNEFLTRSGLFSILADLYNRLLHNSEVARFTNKQVWF